MTLTPKNWATFQHYKDRAPAWIKLHRGILDDFAFSRLPVASRALAPLLWLLASEYEGGKITATLEEIAFRLRMQESELAQAVKPLIDAGFFQSDSALLAACKQDAIPEKKEEREEERQERGEENSPSLRSVALVRRETFSSDWPQDYREQFWERYPRKAGKLAAFKVLDRIRKSGAVTFDRLTAGIGKIPVNDPQFIPHPATWLNRGGWDDEPVSKHGGQNGQRRTGGARQSGGDAFLAGLTEVAQDLHRESPMAWPEAEVIPVGRHNIDG